jgi:hypothetical protein
VNYWAEIDLAWELAEAVATRIPGRDSADAYASIGAGNSYLAIRLLLDRAARERVPLSSELIGRLTEWLEAYAHDDDAPRLRELLVLIATLR